MPLLPNGSGHAILILGPKGSHHHPPPAMYDATISYEDGAIESLTMVTVREVFDFVEATMKASEAIEIEIVPIDGTP